MDVRTIFAERLLVLRRQRGLTQLEVAKNVNITNQTLSGYENARYEPCIGTLCDIADYYNVPVAFLLGRDEETNVDIETLAKDLSESQRAVFAGSLLRAVKRTIKRWEDTYCE